MKNNIFNESETFIIGVELKIAKNIIDFYVPDEKYEEVSSEIFESIYKAIQKEKDIHRMTILVNSIFTFLIKQSHVELAITWLEAGSILNEESKIKGAELKQAHNFLIVQAAYSKSTFSIEEKKRLFSLAAGDEKSDIVKNFNLSLEALIPEAKSKEKVWKEIIDYNSDISLIERRTLMRSFFNRDALKILKPYNERYSELMHEFAN